MRKCWHLYLQRTTFGNARLDEGDYIDGVTSYGYTGDPNKLYSSYFGHAIGSFLAQLP